ncbi:hypothetical protein PG999_000404 [Apiospora kogelbergensis]|uniref:EGF domain-specific O-linked N-acetylglucosamine transferase n=1 Tax=Apiospora kogelbergensis TaxID=1337665 RepID=A0AAW0RBU5_9PEZI
MNLKRRHILGVAGTALLLLLSLKSLGRRRSDTGSDLPASFASSEIGKISENGDGRTTASSLALPAEYSAARLLNLSEPLSDFCRDRFGTEFLEQFSRCRASYCSEDSVSDLTCFHTANPASAIQGSKDSFCLLRDEVSFDINQRKFTAGCKLRDPSQQGETACAIPYRDITSYGYLTGPKFILNEWLSLRKTVHPGSRKETARRSVSQNDNLVVLLKREVDGNIWHCINEIMALMTTLDVLRITPQQNTSTAVLSYPEGKPKTEIIILDDLPDGNYFDLFQMFSGSKPKRLSEWVASKSLDASTDSITSSIGNVIVPFAGSANSLWSDWKPIDCADNTMLRVFVQRIFDFYGIPRTRKQPSTPPRRLRVNFIVRKGSRQLMGLDTYLAAAVRAQFGTKADIHLIDFEGIPFRDQVALARDTDILVGMHGAGLTHTMFMEEGRGALVEIQPDRLCHWGFRNVAKMTGHAYFVAGASKIVGNCYHHPVSPEEGQQSGNGAGAEAAAVEVLPDDGKGAAYDPSRCYVHTTDATAWSLGCSDPKVTGGDRSFWICQNRDANDAWYKTCKKKEAADIWWMTRYIMEQDRFVKLVGDAIETVNQQEQSR